MNIYYHLPAVLVSMIVSLGYAPFVAAEITVTALHEEIADYDVQNEGLTRNVTVGGGDFLLVAMSADHGGPPPPAPTFNGAALTQFGGSWAGSDKAGRTRSGIFYFHNATMAPVSGDVVFSFGEKSDVLGAGGGTLFAIYTLSGAKEFREPVTLAGGTSKRGITYIVDAAQEGDFIFTAATLATARQNIMSFESSEGFAELLFSAQTTNADGHTLGIATVKDFAAAPEITWDYQKPYTSAGLGTTREASIAVAFVPDSPF